MTVRARAAIVLVVAAVAACKGRSAPKVSPVDWAAVEAAAAPAIASGPPDELTHALALLDEVTLPADLQPSDREAAARVAGELPEAAFDAVEALVRWDEADGRLPPRTCKVEGTSSLAAMKLAKVALLVAGDDGESPPARAVLALAARYRAEALSLLEGMVGSAIADATRRWADQRGLTAGAAAQRYQPTEDGLRRIIAAEALCSTTMLAGERSPERAGDLAELARAVGKTPEDLLAAEDAALRRYWVDLLADLRARPSDPAAIDARIEQRADALARQHLQHPVLAIVARPTAHMLAGLRASDDAYRAWLAEPPR